MALNLSRLELERIEDQKKIDYWKERCREMLEAIERCGLIKCHCSVCKRLSICRPDELNYPCSKECAFKKVEDTKAAGGE